MSLSYRDDHDAAISRIAALEQELAAAQDSAEEKSERDRRRVAMLEREIAELQRHEPSTPRRARAPSTPPTPARAAPAEPIDELARRGPAVSRLLMTLLAVLAAGVIAFAVSVVRTDRQPPAPATCRLDTSPSPARITGVINEREVDLGSTPIEMTLNEWSNYRSIKFNVPGYDPLTVDAPKSLSDCQQFNLNLR